MPLGLLSVFCSVFSYLCSPICVLLSVVSYLWSPICGLLSVVSYLWSALCILRCVRLCVFCSVCSANAALERARLTAVAHAATMNAEAVLSGDVGALDAIVDAFYGHDATQVRHSDDDDDAMRWDGMGWMRPSDRTTKRPRFGMDVIGRACGVWCAWMAWAWRGDGVGCVCVCVCARAMGAGGGGGGGGSTRARSAGKGRSRGARDSRAIRDVVCMRAVGVRVVWCRVWWCGVRVASLCGVKKGRMTD